MIIEMSLKLLKLATLSLIAYVIPINTESSDSCNSSQYQFLKGSVYNSGTNTFTGNGVNFNAGGLPQDARIRIPGRIFTADYVESRLNIRADVDGTCAVVEVYCG
ncbi:hypothetical protein CONCODRAFT_152834 [Conidiobolus coronatus NRRL 28638]|uniref:Uncharacterized protein n=1 Tax=Conidiobolus coronatus (strain ATCC 28846 / CBS 209.66 / NRRL 28638) TaxID=796925 RepID=A0A137NQD7_CONC2|nr:hypothetical protein CONCODRAFT_152834 [Conidiobolus coronatus NRRL 28638]|eukprot:KXN64924.1 hypothetical protein CONCODRAFT_152834 [Conidiobolus coronatus NRRL 28638]